jgi:cyanophycin synthetase
LRVIDSRRLFGPSLDSDGPAAIAEVAFEDGEDAEAAISRWRAAIQAVVPDASTRERRFRGGAALVVRGELDQILILCDVNEAAIAGAVDVPALRAALDAAIDPPLRALLTPAMERGVPVLVDDVLVSVGLGAGSVTYPREAIGAPDWAAVGRIPVAMVTGTNGKTTSARLLARMAAEAGHVVGLATTDGVHVGGELVAAGDYTGPDAARMVLRDRRVTLAVLETARGGILRRGLAIDRCDVALLTNVSDDHLGLYGVDDVATMAQVKAVVGHAADRVVVNGDDPWLAGMSFAAPVTRFGLAGGDFTLRGDTLVGDGRPLAEVEEVPIAFGGAARHNVANALGAAAAAAAVGIPWDPIRRALLGFRADENPARGNLWSVGKARLLLDFGHNSEGVRAVLGLARALTAGRLLVVLGLPGDRDDDSLRAVGRAVAAAQPARVFVHDLQGYLRGRAPGAVPAIVEDELQRSGVDGTHIERTPGELAGLERALGAAGPGDLVVLFPHLERAAVEKLLVGRDARPVDERILRGYLSR